MSTGIATVGSGTEYVFSSTVTLLPNTRYWFYTQDTTAGEYAVGVAGPDSDRRYRAGGSTSGYQGPNNSMMIYSLQGSPVPEPDRGVGLTGIVFTGLLGLCADRMVRARVANEWRELAFPAPRFANCSSSLPTGPAHGFFCLVRGVWPVKFSRSRLCEPFAKRR